MKVKNQAKTNFRNGVKKISRPGKSTRKRKNEIDKKEIEVGENRSKGSGMHEP